MRCFWLSQDVLATHSPYRDSQDCLRLYIVLLLFRDSCGVYLHLETEAHFNCGYKVARSGVASGCCSVRIAARHGRLLQACICTFMCMYTPRVVTAVHVDNHLNIFGPVL